MSETPFSPYQAPAPFYAPPPPTSKLQLWALIVGIAALVLSWVPIFGLLLGLAAVVLGIIALTRKVRRANSAIGLALGVVAVIINIIVLVALGSTVKGAVDAVATVAPAAATEPTADTTTEPAVDPTTQAPAVAPTTEAPPVVKPTKTLSAEQKNAIEAAQDYLDYQAFSRKGLIRQLSSDAGDGYPVKVATFAVDSLDVNWNEQAVKSAKQYLSFSHFSRKGLIEQLQSDAGEGFTHSQAVYGVDKTGL